MNKKIILIILFILSLSLLIGNVSAETFKANCHGGDENHKVTWNKKYYGTTLEGTAKKNGKYYNRHAYIYKYSMNSCKHYSHENYLKHSPDGYGYTTISMYDIRNGAVKYKYLLMTKETTKNPNNVVVKSNKEYYYYNNKASKLTQIDTYTPHYGEMSTTSTKIKINSKLPKYAIKSVKIQYYKNNKLTSKTFKGYNKKSLNINLGKKVYFLKAIINYKIKK